MFKTQTRVSHRLAYGGRSKAVLPDVFATPSEASYYWLGWFTANTSLVHITQGMIVSTIAVVAAPMSEKDHLLDGLTFVGLPGRSLQTLNRKNHQTVSMRSAALADLLIAHGVVKDRSVRTSKDVPEAYLPHFWRGFIQANSQVGYHEGVLFLDIQAPTQLMRELITLIQDLRIRVMGIENQSVEIARIENTEITFLNEHAVAFYNYLIVEGDISVLSNSYHTEVEQCVTQYEDSIINQ